MKLLISLVVTALVGVLMVLLYLISCFVAWSWIDVSQFYPVFRLLLVITLVGSFIGISQE